ncbi:MAG: hypothetical protein OXC82_06830 [Rhodobacteraceae bacterium]|nr:hypothetical protein [Paracoccaceae bacterium]MCY4250132.1 hypothetical protein [Paracoccaceae bacterium]MCY4309667.1 hypothetical protein [Paracoccaceae bacterium]
MKQDSRISPIFSRGEDLRISNAMLHDLHDMLLTGLVPSSAWEKDVPTRP